ncbi:MAG TPA: RNB domain-containing ribonuclease [Candidatus Eisenbacteria bacterium]|nr:RNB domain-containing ribonuclease [Candidatus Eisenbacteria bacterium]
MSAHPEDHRALLLRVARRAMVDRGLEPDFPRAVQTEVDRLRGPAPAGDAEDMTALPWCSIDNDDSRDLDQLTVAEAMPDGAARVRVAVADVDAIVTQGSAVDDHAHANTTSVYTAARVFAMLPERLSTDLTSLNPDQDRLALVVEMRVDRDGRVTASRLTRARVRNKAKLAYPSVGAWLQGQGAQPPGIAAVAGLADNLRLQDTVAQTLRRNRQQQGALELQTLEPEARLVDGRVGALELKPRTRADDIIEDFMIASNGVTAAFLEAHRFPVMRRVLRSPERWARIVALAADCGDTLPGAPDAAALNTFLVRQRARDPQRFPDVSLSVIKLLGRGEYFATFPGEAEAGHFALAVTDYTHSTAPNRRYPDLITSRLLKAALAGGPVPYARDQLTALATHCTMRQDDAQKVERLVRKAAAACLLEDQIGREFDGVVTGASDKGTWVRVFDPPVEGRVERGAQGLDVGDRARVRLISTNPERGFIDFERVGHRPLGNHRHR